MGSNRGAYKAGPSFAKWAECLLLGGGVPAILIPFLGFYVAWIQIRKQKEYAECKAAMGKDDSDYTRFIVGINQLLMYLFFVFIIILYSKPRRTKRQIKTVGILFPILLVAIIVITVMNWGLYAGSACKDKNYGTAAIVSNTVLFMLDVVTALVAIILFICNTRTAPNQARVTHAEERDSLVNKNDESAKPPPPPKPKPEEKEEEYRPGGDDFEDEGGDGGGDDDGIE